jgi:hypothetical protein
MVKWNIYDKSPCLELMCYSEFTWLIRGKHKNPGEISGSHGGE